MKGRLFPSYEYRLYIRHHTSENEGAESSNKTNERRDTVLMVAKNRRKKTSEAASGSKKGSNNYYLRMPGKDDVESHFIAKNGKQSRSYGKVFNGACHTGMSGDSHTPLLGRLQSNFIGTEFQIFSPRATKAKDRRASDSGIVASPAFSRANSGSEDELDGYDSGMSSDTGSTPRRKNRFARLSLRRSLTNVDEDTESDTEGGRRRKSSLRRSRSFDYVRGRSGRRSRRAIANTDNEPVNDPSSLKTHPGYYEVEDGAITYTANLLGSRPRIMDVCIPKVSPEGAAGLDWAKYVESCMSEIDGAGAGTGSLMLNRFRQVQQQLQDATDAEPQDEPVDNDIEEPAGGDGYTPPRDFGLLALQNRPPWWNAELGSFVLNFGGRVSVASVKNFQLCDREDQDHIMLQFGRIAGRHSFTMDFQYPLTAVQAFAIAISSLQSKISFG